MNRIKDILVYAATCEKWFEANVEDNGYTRISTFYSDLSIAERYGINAIKITFDNVVEQWKNDYKMFTEFIMSLNLKAWQFSTDTSINKANMEYSELYSELFYKAQDIAYEVFSDEGKSYLFRMTD